MKELCKYDYRKLLGRIKEICGTQEAFADSLSMNRATLTQKLKNRTSFTQPEIDRACDILHIEASDIPVYFFALDDAKNHHDSRMNTANDQEN